MAGRVPFAGRVECPERAKRVEGHHLLQSSTHRLADSLVTREHRSLLSSLASVLASGRFLSHRRRMPFVYILRCSDGSLYVGWTDDVNARLSMHKEGRGGHYTKRHLSHTARTAGADEGHQDRCDETARSNAHPCRCANAKPLQMIDPSSLNACLRNSTRFSPVRMRVANSGLDAVGDQGRPSRVRGEPGAARRLQTDYRPRSSQLSYRSARGAEFARLRRRAERRQRSSGNVPSVHYP